jgi:hypothetical protein
MNKLLRDESWNSFLKKAKSKISENNYPFEEVYINSRLAETEGEILAEFDARAAEFTFTHHILAARKHLQEKSHAYAEEILKHNAAISEEFCTNLLVHIYECFNS